MKKNFVVVVILGMLSCHSSNNKTEDSKTKNEAGVQNVNGNIADTTNAINLSTHKKDTTRVPSDSLKR